MQDTLEKTVPAEVSTEVDNLDGDRSETEANPADVTDASTVPELDTNTIVPTEETASPDGDETATYLPIYNGNVCPIRADAREEITTLLQLGMKQRDFLPQYERLSRLAADHGDASVKALIDRLCETAEKERFVNAVKTYGETDGKRFYEMERAARERRYEELEREKTSREQQAENDRAQRLADQFSQLQAAYPEYTDIRHLPREVIQSALTQDISLLDAYHRFTIAEQQRRKQEVSDAAAANKAATGSLAQTDHTAPSAIDAFVSGLYSRR